MARNHEEVKQITLLEDLARSITDFGMLVKFKLTLLVLFSALMSYAIVRNGQVNMLDMLWLGLGGFLITGAANALNQVLERDFDKLMPRTMNRPVAAGRMSVSKAVLWAGLMALGGEMILATFNPLTVFFGTFSLISYAFVYTPMKRFTPLAVVVGAVPGALPLIIGAVAQEGFISPMAIMLFAIQFLWQFPHFWAVAWVADDDYKKGGFYLLPTKNGEKNSTTGLLSIGFCVLMVLNSIVCYYLGYVGPVATLVLIALHLFWATRCWRLFRTCTREAARSQMFVSFWHLPVSLIVLLLDTL